VSRDQVGVHTSDLYANWLAVLDAFDVEFLVLDTHRDHGLLQAVRSDPRWIVDVEDREAVLFARAGASA
jgi:hypothetical protein